MSGGESVNHIPSGIEESITACLPVDLKLHGSQVKSNERLPESRVLPVYGPFGGVDLKYVSTRSNQTSRMATVQREGRYGTGHDGEEKRDLFHQKLSLENVTGSKYQKTIGLRTHKHGMLLSGL